MNYPFTYEEGSLLVRLIIAHIITDFILQSDKGVKNKKEKILKSQSFWIHGLYTCITVGLFMWNKLNWPILFLITISHILIDYLKLSILKRNTEKLKNRELWLFVGDQFLHIIILISAWLMIIDGVEKMSELLEGLFLNYQILLKILGYLIVIGPVTYLIRFLTSKWSDDVSKNNNSLEDAGKWIGILERIIVITLVFIEQYTALGFLVTAKSILRLIDKPDGPIILQDKQGFSSRKHTEYVLIGTFLSFGSALITALIIDWLLKL